MDSEAANHSWRVDKLEVKCTVRHGASVKHLSYCNHWVHIPAYYFQAYFIPFYCAQFDTTVYTQVNKRIRLFPKLQGNIMKAKIDHTPKPRHLFGSTCTWQKSQVVGKSYTIYDYTEFRLSGVGSPCWLGVHRGLPKELSLVSCPKEVWARE